MLSYSSVRLLSLIPAFYIFFFSSRRRHTSSKRDWSSDVCSSDLLGLDAHGRGPRRRRSPCARSLADECCPRADPRRLRRAGPLRHPAGRSVGQPLRRQIGRASCRERVRFSLVVILSYKEESVPQS